jgi:hypothetical protein
MSRHSTGRGRSVRTQKFDEDILQRFKDNPSTNTRAVACELDVDRHLVWNVVREQWLHPFHRQKVQAVGPNDYLRREEFARLFVHQSTEKTDFPAIVLFVDEACFSLEWIFNANKSCLGRNKPSCCISSFHYQQRFAVNVRAGNVREFLIGPTVLLPQLNAQIYRVFLEETLEEIPLALRRDMWFQHDGASARFSPHVLEHLATTCKDRYIGRGGPVHWPPRSPDLTPLDLWLYMQNLLYSSPVNSEEDLIFRIVEAAATIRRKTGIVESTRQFLLLRFRWP